MDAEIARPPMVEQLRIVENFDALLKYVKRVGVPVYSVARRCHCKAMPEDAKINENIVEVQ